MEFRKQKKHTNQIFGSVLREEENRHITIKHKRKEKPVFHYNLCTQKFHEEKGMGYNQRPLTHNYKIKLSLDKGKWRGGGSGTERQGLK
jgi:cell fate regulator YaaT (PSP1 superfamily)